MPFPSTWIRRSTLGLVTSFCKFDNIAPRAITQLIVVPVLCFHHFELPTSYGLIFHWESIVFGWHGLRQKVVQPFISYNYVIKINPPWLGESQKRLGNILTTPLYSAWESNVSKKDLETTSGVIFAVNSTKVNEMPVSNICKNLKSYLCKCVS